MPSIDMPVEELFRYKPQLTQPEDLEEFWSQTLKELRAEPLASQIEPIEFPNSSRTAFFKVRFRGFGNTMITGYLARPKEIQGKSHVSFYTMATAAPKPSMLVMRYTTWAGQCWQSM